MAPAAWATAPLFIEGDEMILRIAIRAVMEGKYELAVKCCAYLSAKELEEFASSVKIMHTSFVEWVSAQ